MEFITFIFSDFFVFVQFVFLWFLVKSFILKFQKTYLQSRVIIKNGYRKKNNSELKQPNNPNNTEKNPKK